MGLCGQAITWPEGRLSNKKGEKMSTKTGLLLINAGGEMFFIRNGILGSRLGEDTTFAEIDPTNPEIRAITDFRIDDSEIKAFEDGKRQAVDLPIRTYPGPRPRPGQENLGPILFQAFNVEVVTDEGGESEITGNGTGGEGGG